jgi:FixJ family two-component response regulator
VPPFIISTGMGDEFIAVDMMKRGARDYLVKNSQFSQTCLSLLTVSSENSILKTASLKLRISSMKIRKD